MSMHTPGPWTLGNGEVRIRTEKNEQGRSILVAECYTTNNAGRYPKLEERKANARLIAVAPELLEVLKRFVDVCDNGSPIDIFDALGGCVEPARQAIAKAESN